MLRSRPLVDLRRDVGHLHYFVRDTALATLRECGFEVLDAFYTAGALDLPSRHWRARLLRLPRRALRAIDEDLCARLLGGFSLMVLARAAGAEPGSGSA